jgi:hypothetical protein
MQQEHFKTSTTTAMYAAGYIKRIIEGNMQLREHEPKIHWCTEEDGDVIYNFAFDFEEEECDVLTIFANSRAKVMYCLHSSGLHHQV